MLGLTAALAGQLQSKLKQHIMPCQHSSNDSGCSFPQVQLKCCTGFSWCLLMQAIGLCLGRGPLVGSWNIAQTTMLYTFPIYPCQDVETKKGRLGDSHGTTAEAIRSFIGNTTLLCILGYVLSHELPKVLAHYLYGIALYAFITFLMDGPAALLIAVLGMRVVPPFDKPWLSTSVGDYWGRRWNNTTGLTLRALVYDPIVEGSLMGRAALEARKPSPKPSQKSPNKPPQKPYRPPMWLKLFGMCATFAVSGVMHEILLYMLAPEGQYHVGYWFTFFFIQAPIMFAEGLVLRALHNRKIYIPRTLAIPLTTATVLTTAWYFWYPPIENHTDIANEAVASINANVGALIAWGQGLCEQWDLKQGLESQMATLGQMWPGIRAYVAESATSP
eukprot:GHUV01022828.1.p1 GENE.GHUV01022828.1~~GHUV01022828.1.p1  ORF type:complete len:388 (+),score=71.64 GHUV01022828.1:501-1664(+)